MDMTLPMTKAIAKASLADYAAVINDAHRAAYGYAHQAIEHARNAGEHLIKAKAAMNHGEWLPWLAANVEVGERQARRYMAVADNWSAISAKTDFKSDLTLSSALDALAKHKVDLPEKPAPKYESDSYLPVKSDPQPEPQKPAKPVAPVEVEKLQTQLEKAHERLAEMSTQQQEMHEELTFLQKVEDAGDKLAEALAEVKRLQAEVRILKERINGLMNEKNEAIRAAKMWQRRCEKAEKAA